MTNQLAAEIDPVAEQAALFAFLAYLQSPELGEKIREIMASNTPRTLSEIAAAIGFPPVIFRLGIIHLALKAKELDNSEPAPEPTKKRSSKEIFDACLSVTPMDGALNETVRLFASATLQNRAVKLLEKSATRSVSEIAAALGLQPATIQIEAGARLAEMTGATVEIPLGAAGGGAIMVFRPKFPGVTQ